MGSGQFQVEPANPFSLTGQVRVRGLIRLVYKCKNMMDYVKGHTGSVYIHPGQMGFRI
ncbi:hypothetical protein HanPSC8_Chr11g0487541 [Helianthus annuus]|nr:hypothetical protein HanPSC8_Chr11g0487541 [Helianthus annuus]